MITIHDEGVIFIHPVGYALSITRAEFCRDQVCGEDGLFTPDVPVVYNVGNRSYQVAIAQILLLFDARVVDEQDVAILVTVDSVGVVWICRQQT